MTEQKKDIFDFSEEEFISYFTENFSSKYNEFVEVKDMEKIIIIILIIFTIPLGPLAIIGWIYFFKKREAFKKTAFLNKDNIFSAFGFQLCSGQENDNRFIKRAFTAERSIDKIEIDEVIKFSYHNIPFTIFDIIKTDIEKDKEGQEHHKDYHRIYLATNINKNFNKDVYLSNYFAVGNNVHLEDVEFSKEYKVYAQDQVEARYLLTPTFMERLLKYTKEKKLKMDISFSQKEPEYGNLFFQIYTNENMFEFKPLFHPDTKKVAQEIYRVLQEIKHFMAIVEALKLDQDIGM